MTVATPRINVLLSPFQNAFFAELSDVLVAELTALGVEARLVAEPHTLQADERDVFVMLPPHEWVTLEGDAWLQDPRVAERTIGIGAEQPGSPFFDRNATIARHLGALFDFSERAVDAFRAQGVDAHHLPFGYTAHWDRFVEDGNLDGPDVLFMGNFKARRLDALAKLAPTLGLHRTHLVLGDNTAPNTGSSRWFVAGDDKRRLLASTKVLLNIHQGGEPYFEWLRFTEAALSGAVVLTEPSTHSDPYLPGEHFVAAPLGRMADALDDLLADDGERRRLRSNAYDVLRAHPFRDSVTGLVAVAATLTELPVPTTLPARTRRDAFTHSNSIAPVPPARIWTSTAPRTRTEIVVVGDIEVAVPPSTPAGDVTVTRVADRVAALAAMRASSAAAVGVVDRPGELTPVGLEALQHLVAAGADVAGAMVAEPTSTASWAPRRLTGLWQPTDTTFDPFQGGNGWFLTRPDRVDVAERRIVARGAVAHAPMPVLVTTQPPPPLVVVVMATFQPAPELFHRQVQSLRDQTLGDFVCVVSDDGSGPEHVAAIRRELSVDHRFVLIANDERVGFYRNFERGLALARDRHPAFVALADQDDVWYPTKLERAVEQLTTTGASMVFTDVAPVDGERRLLAPTFFGHRHPTTDDVLDLTMMNAAIGATSMFRSELLDVALPFPPQRYRSFHDHWLARCAQLSRGLTFDPHVSMEYVQHGGNVQGFIARRSRWGAARLLFTAKTIRPDEDHARAQDTEMLRGRLAELRELEARFGPSPELAKAIRRHEEWAGATASGLARLYAMWTADHLLRRRPRRENIEIYYTQAWHDIRARERGNHDA